MDAKQLSQRIEEILAGELALYREMEQFSREQIAALSLDTPDIEKAAEMIRAKQSIVQSLNKLDKDSREIKEEWESVADTLDEEIRKPVRAVAADIARLLETLMKLEKENEDCLKRNAADLNRELLAIQRARLASRAYGSRIGPDDPRFLDRKQ